MLLPLVAPLFGWLQESTIRYAVVNAIGKLKTCGVVEDPEATVAAPHCTVNPAGKE